MSASNPYERPTVVPGEQTLGLRDHLICGAIAILMWVSSAAVLAAFAFGAMVAIIGPYSDLGGTVQSLSEVALQRGAIAGGAVIAVVSTVLATVTFFRVQRGRRKTTVVGQRREELTRAVAALREDVRRRRATEATRSQDET